MKPCAAPEARPINTGYRAVCENNPRLQTVHYSLRGKNANMAFGLEIRNRNYKIRGKKEKKV